MKYIIILSLLFCLIGPGLFAATAEKKQADLFVADPGRVEYKVTVGDTISIQVYEEPDLSGDFEVKEDGTITYPLLGSVKVSSLSKSETESTITRLLEKDYLVNPYIHITIKKYHQQNIIILGCVQKPGSYPFPPDMNLTLLQAISIAGGFTGYASVNDTKLVRTSSGGKKNTIDARVNDIVNGRRKDIRLEANDLIFVPERLF